jgi:hypothetical protein
LLTQHRQQGFRCSERGAEFAFPRQRGLDLAERLRKPLVLQQVHLMPQPCLRRRRLSKQIGRVDQRAQRRGQSSRQSLHGEPLPIFNRSRIVALVIRLQSAQEKFPFEKRRTQTNALECFARHIIVAGFKLSKSLEDAIEVAAYFFGQQGSAIGFLLDRRIRGANQDLLSRRRIRNLLKEQQGLTHLAASGQFLA